MDFVGGEVEAPAVGGELDVGHLEAARGDRAGGDAFGPGVDRVEVGEARRLRNEPQRVVVHPAEARRAQIAHPGVVVLPIEHPALPGGGVQEHQPAILVVGRAHHPHRLLAIPRQQGQAPPHLARRGRGGLGLLVGVRLRIGGRFVFGPGDAVDEGPDARPRLQVEDGEAAALLRVSDVAAAFDRLRIGGFGHVAGHIRDPRPLRLLRDEEEGMPAVSGERGFRHGLALGHLEAGRRFLFLLLLLALLARGRLVHVPEELPLLVLHVLLARGELGLLLPRARVRELHHEVALAGERDAEQAALAHEGDLGLAPSEAGARLRRGGAGDLTPRAGHGVDEHHVVLVHEQAATVRAVPFAGGRGSPAAGFIGEPPRLSPVAGHAPGGGLVLVLARLPPFEEELLRVSRPAQSGRPIADELRPAHDLVDREGRRGSLVGDEGQAISAGTRRDPGDALLGGVGEAGDLAEVLGPRGKLEKARALPGHDSPVRQPGVVLDSFGQQGDARGLPGRQLEALQPPLRSRHLADEAHRAAAGDGAQAAADVRDHHLRAPRPEIRHLERRRVREHEEHEGVGIGPGVVADGLDLG